ncbi:MAG: hypothetical protein QOI21_4278 [Actinomycetota bacterium]|nr:hypothetical protein [Actinomycetota bacterium]
MSVLTREGHLRSAGRGRLNLIVRERIREGVRKGSAVKSDPDDVRVLRPRPRAGESRRPPTRARVVAGRRPATVAPCAPRPMTVRWPWLTGLAVAACLAITGLGLLAGGMATAEVPAGTAVVSVAPGETLSDLAARFAPNSDTGAVVERIKQLNMLEDATLVPGIPLTVPAEAELPNPGS